MVRRDDTGERMGLGEGTRDKGENGTGLDGQKGRHR